MVPHTSNLFLYCSCIQREGEDTGENGTSTRGDLPVTTQPESMPKPTNEPIVLGPPPPANGGANSPNENTPINAADEKPQMYAGYKY